MSLADLHRAVEATLASKRLGQPVFLRYTWQTPGGGDKTFEQAAHLAGVFEGWFGQRIRTVYAAHGPGADNVSVTLQFEGGASALLAVVAAKPRGSGIDIMLMGQNGAMYHDTGSDQQWDEPAAVPKEPADAGIRMAISQSLRRGQPVAPERSRP
jgi:predicted dehydrogenase